ncbi:hypothetical protein [Pseudoalteromonas luteoviolacea]|uniref:Uncharacterized protein n=1 Tax=Pseudoalteromonas luteoviolacea S4060-1 TaxID=1365257 RepID=A0A167JRJ2_9GAMM|nr:hypothetical protein [Pseudoalteromonas luteoviolacea]KZN61561.1 hypothetical protein N478_05705 [Pseudoalteromonas luteoviolacea S4060-1]
MSELQKLVNTVELLVDTVEEHTPKIQQSLAESAQKIADKEQQVDAFLANARPEQRIVQDITIGGSADYFYPVWFTMPDNEFGTARLEIHRFYAWNGAEGERPLTPLSNHQASLNLELEGSSNKSGGDANFLMIKRFSERYNMTSSHVAFQMFATQRLIDVTKPAFNNLADGTFDALSNKFSGIYLRGGGLTYRFTKNWAGDINFYDEHTPIELENFGATANAKLTVAPIPIAERIEPNATLVPYEKLLTGATA